MSSPSITELLRRAHDGDEAASQALIDQVYEELKVLARGVCGPGEGARTLSATAVVHEAFLRMHGGAPLPAFGARRQFYAFAAKVMRSVLVDHARRRNAQKRGGKGSGGVGDSVDLLPLDEARDVVSRDRFDWIEFDDALSRLAEMDARLARQIELRMFAGLTLEEVAAEMEMSERTARRDWKLGKAWLARELGGRAAPD